MRNPLCSLFICSLAAVLLVAAPVFAAIELDRAGGDKLVLQETYQREGVAFVAIDEVLAAAGLNGQWDNVDHVYRIETGQGVAVISPGSDYLRLGERAIKVAHRPRFIGGRLLVSEDFLAGQLIPALALPLQVNNLNPVAPPPAESPLDLLFSLFLQQRPRAVADSQWVVAIDPGHGGQDAGALGQDGITEQAVNLGVALHLQKLLKMRRDAPVIMTRDGDYAVSAVQRLETVSKGQADVLLSLHTQAFASPIPQGLALFVAPPKSVPSPSGVPAESAPARARSQCQPASGRVSVCGSACRRLSGRAGSGAGAAPAGTGRSAAGAGRDGVFK